MEVFGTALPSDEDVTKTLMAATDASRTPEQDAYVRRRRMVEAAVAPPAGVTAIQAVQTALDRKW